MLQQAPQSQLQTQAQTLQTLQTLQMLKHTLQMWLQLPTHVLQQTPRTQTQHEPQMQTLQQALEQQPQMQPHMLQQTA